MRISYRETSREAYRMLNIIPASVAVYNAICVLQSNLKRGCTDVEVKEYLTKNSGRIWESAQVSARRKFLVDNGLVKEVGKITNIYSDRPNITWQTVSLDWEKGVNTIKEYTA
jgi:hypothetical protein